MLWVLILAIYGAALALFGRQVPPALRARALAIQGLIAAGFSGVFRCSPRTRSPASSRFPRRAWASIRSSRIPASPSTRPASTWATWVSPSRSRSASPGSWARRSTPPGARLARPWVLLAWCFLTAGIALGSWWAYYELGWGGWWFWDPVGKRLVHPVADRYRAAPLAPGRGEARHAEGLDPAALHHRLLAVPAGNLPGAIGRDHFRAYVRQRPGPRTLHPRVPRSGDRGCVLSCLPCGRRGSGPKACSNP